ncbi:MAG: hypothetical protein QXE35_06205 [Acidilobaceae archaeon]
MNKYKSFVDGLVRFYEGAWKLVKRAGKDYIKVVNGILRAAKSVDELMIDYANYLLRTHAPLLVKVGQKEFSLKRSLSLDYISNIHVEVKGVKKLLLSVVGLLDKPGKGYWLYAYSPEYERFLVMRVNPKDPRRLAEKVRFKEVVVRAEKGSLRFIPAINKVYRYKSKLKFKVVGDLKRLPHLETKQIHLFRRGLIFPNLLVEVPIPSEGGQLAPGLGFIAVVGSGRLELAGHSAIFKADDLTLRLKHSYAKLGREGGSHVLLLFLQPTRDIDGYYLGGVACEDVSRRPAHYLPSNLLIELKGAEIAESLKDLPHELLKFYEPVTEKERLEYEALKMKGATAKRRALQAFYSMKREDKFVVPNLQFIKYKEVSVWFKAAMTPTLKVSS